MPNNWSDLTAAQKELYTGAAHDILYPDLRPGYRDHEKLIALLARNLYYLETDTGGKYA